MPFRRLVLLPGLALGLAACQRPDGIQAPVVLLEPVHAFGADESLHDIRDLQLRADGELWVLTGLPPYLRRYTPDGRERVRFGRSGRGPGELLNPWSIFPVPDAADHVGVWDPALRRIVILEPDGQAVGGYAVPVAPGPVRADIRQVAFGPVSRVRAWQGRLVLQQEPRGVTHPSHLRWSRLLRLDTAGAVLDTIADFDRRAIAGGSPAARVWAPVPLWAVCPDGRLAYLDPYEGAVVWVDSAGRPRGRRPLHHRPRRITREDRLRYLAHVVRLEAGPGADVDAPARARALLDEFRGWFPERAPPAVDLLCAAAGRVWLQQFDTATDPIGRGRDWLVVDESTVERGLRFPSGFQPVALGLDAVFGVYTDSLDVQSVARVELPASLR